MPTRPPRRGVRAEPSRAYRRPIREPRTATMFKERGGRSPFAAEAAGTRLGRDEVIDQRTLTGYDQQVWDLLVERLRPNPQRRARYNMCCAAGFAVRERLDRKNRARSASRLHTGWNRR
jgi:hypothetical protein